MKTILLWDTRFPDRRPTRLTLDDGLASACVRAGVAAAADPADQGALMVGGVLDPAAPTEVVIQHGANARLARVYLPASVAAIGAALGLVAGLKAPISGGTPAPAPTLGTLTLSAVLVAGTASTGTINGATAGSTITSNVAGLTVNSAARTYSWDGTGAATTTANGLIETLAGATGSPASSPVTVAIPAAIIAKAQRISTAAAAANVASLTSVISPAATVTVGGSGSNSTLDPTITFTTGGKYFVNDTARFEQVAGKLAVSSGTKYTGQGRTSNVSTSAKGSTYGNGVRTRYAGQKFEVFFSGTGYFAIHVIDPTTGAVKRATNLDVQGAINAFVLVDFGSAADRIIEVYAQGSMTWSGFVPQSGQDFTLAATPATVPKLALVWDSWGAGTLTASTSQTLVQQQTKLATSSYLGAALGNVDMWCSCTGGTGLLWGSPSWPATSSATSGSYLDRINLGDINPSLLGNLDALIISGSVNDNYNNNSQKPTDAQVQTAMQNTIAKAMTEQPGAIIIGMGPQDTYNGTSGNVAGQSRYDACKAGFMAAAGNDPRMVWVDISPAGAGVFANTANNAAWIGSDGLHPNDTGKVQYSAALASAILSKLRAQFGVS